MEYNGITYPNSPLNVKQEYTDGQYHITWDSPMLDELSTPIRYYSVYLCDGTNVDINDLQTVAAHIVKDNEFTYSSTDPNLRFAVTTFDKNYYESAPAISETNSIDNIVTHFQICYAHDILTITGNKSVKQVDIYSISGTNLRHAQFNVPEVSINCSDFSKGMYIARIIYCDGTTTTHKFIR